MVMSERRATEVIDVTYFPVCKSQALGPRRTKQVRAKRGENPFLAAERALRKSFTAQDFVILDASLASSRFIGGFMDWADT